jgi:cbb3-type cytochrome oxidase maturation protein
MESLFLLIPLSLVLVAVIAAFFYWSIKNGQFDDLEGPGHAILMDDDTTVPQSKKPLQASEKKENLPN